MLKSSSSSNAQELRRPASPSDMDGLKATFLPNLSMEASVLTTAHHFCPMCGQQFETPQHAAEHLQLCHGVITGVGGGSILLAAPPQHPSVPTEALKIEYSCLNCDDKFSTSMELDDHQRLIHQSPAFLARCLACGIYGISSATLQEGDEYKCLHCGSVCTASSLTTGHAGYLDHQSQGAPHSPDEMPSMPPEEMNSLAPQSIDTEEQQRQQAVLEQQQQLQQQEQAQALLQQQERTQALQQQQEQALQQQQQEQAQALQLQRQERAQALQQQQEQAEALQLQQEQVEALQLQQEQVEALQLQQQERAQALQQQQQEQVEALQQQQQEQAQALQQQRQEHAQALQQQQLQQQQQQQQQQQREEVQRKVPPLTVKLNKSGNGVDAHPQVIIKQEPLNMGDSSGGSGERTPTSVPVYTIHQAAGPGATSVLVNTAAATAAANANANATTTVLVGNKVRHKCPECPKTFKTPGTLAMHHKVHTGEADATPKERPYTCSYCGKSFTQSNTLKQHTRIHTGEKPFHCGYCEKSFSVKDYLTKHIRTHTGEKPYTCPYCDKRFTQRSALTVHTTKLHPL